MARRIAVLVLGAGLLLAGALLLRRGDEAGAPLPDVVLIAVDTVRGDHVGCLGNGWIRTPNLDALARDGVAFRNCFATAPWTLPSFASIFTGLLPSHHGAVGGGHDVLDDDFVTLAEHFDRVGYRTYGFATVKWLTPAFGMAQGLNFDIPIAPPEGLGGGAAVTALGIATLDLPRDRPLFTLLHYFDAHAPYAPPPPFARMYYEGNERAPGAPLLTFLLSDANRAPNKADGMYRWLDGVTDPDFPEREYAASVTYVDDQVGQIVKAIKKRDRYEETMIVVVADHGEHLGEHDIWYTHTLPYQETLHVPLIVKLPGGRLAGRVIDEPVSTLDVLPTVLDWADLSQPVVDGRSLRGLMEGRDPGAGSLLVAEQGSRAHALCKTLIEWPYKLMLTRDRGGDGYALFDLATDPGELQDLSESRPEELSRLRRRLWELFDGNQALGRAELSRPATLDEMTRRDLRSLGYAVGPTASDGPAIPAGGAPTGYPAAP